MSRPVHPSRRLRTDLARDSNQRVVEILVRWGLLTLAALSLVATWVGVELANGDARHQSEEFRSLATALVQANINTAERQRILLTYQNDRFEEDREGILSLLLVDGEGQIVLSTRPGWVGRALQPELMAAAASRDPELRRIASCFARPAPGRRACFRESQGRYRPWSDSLTLARPLRIYDRQAGLTPRDYLLVVSFDPGVFTARLMAELGLAVLGFTVITALLVALLAQRLQQGLLPNLRQFAETDALTGLMNRSAFMDLAVQLLAQGQREGLPYVLGVIDIDHFKAINDGHGHLCGDEVLQKLARVLEGSLRDVDLVTRLGGEEFAVLLQCGPARGETLMERLRTQVEVSHLSFEGRPLRVTVSLGGASTDLLGYNLDYLYSAADAALYRAKREGRNRVRWASARRERMERPGWSPGDAWHQSFKGPEPGADGRPAGNPAPGEGRPPRRSSITTAQPPRPQP